MKLGKGNVIIGIIIAIHGNETAPLTVLEKLPKLELGNYQLKIIIVNQKAIDAKTRFIDTDLNRIFPGNLDGNHEEKLAHELLEEVEECDFVLDFHTSKKDSPPCVLTTNLDKAHLNMCKRVGITNVVFMKENPIKGKSLIDYCNLGISIELGKHDSNGAKKTFLDVIKSFLTEKTKDISLFETIKLAPSTPSELSKQFGLRNGVTVAGSLYLFEVWSKEKYLLPFGEDYRLATAKFGI